MQIYDPDSPLGLDAACNKLAEHLQGINSLVIAKMDGNNWYPPGKVRIASCAAWFCLFGQLFF
jgi:hypothetical protein